MNKVFWDIIHCSFTDVWNASLGFSTGAKKSYTFVKKKKISLMNTCSLSPESVSRKSQSHSLLSFRLSIWTRGKKKLKNRPMCTMCRKTINYFLCHKWITKHCFQPLWKNLFIAKQVWNEVFLWELKYYSYFSSLVIVSHSKTSLSVP